MVPVYTMLYIASSTVNKKQIEKAVLVLIGGERERERRGRSLGLLHISVLDPDLLGRFGFGGRLPCSAARDAAGGMQAAGRDGELGSGFGGPALAAGQPRGAQARGSASDLRGDGKAGSRSVRSREIVRLCLHSTFSPPGNRSRSVIFNDVPKYVLMLSYSKERLGIPTLLLHS